MTPQELIAYIEGLIIDNTTKEVSPYKLRSVLIEIVNSLNQSNISSLSAVLPLEYDPFTNVLSLPIVDDLTTGGSNAVLSAEQGKALKELIDNIVISGGGVPEAPNDGKLYGRKSATWTQAGIDEVLKTGATAIDKQLILDTSDPDGTKTEIRPEFISNEDKSLGEKIFLINRRLLQTNELLGSYEIDFTDGIDGLNFGVKLKAPILTADEIIATQEWVTANPPTIVVDADDINETATRVFVTPSQKIILSNTSGTNTGDNVQATESVSGIAEIATQAETNTGTDNLRIVTALKLATWWTNIKTLAQSISGIWTFTNGSIFGGLTNPTYQKGLVFYDNNAESLAVYDDISGTTLNVGQESYIRCRNNSGSTILNGSVVYITGALGQNPTIGLARANALATSVTIGIATHDIPNNTVGKITTFGLVSDLNTSAYTDGQLLYLSASTAGILTSTIPSSPNFCVYVCIVAHAHATQGKLFVRPEQPISLDTSMAGNNDTSPSVQAVRTYAFPKAGGDLTGTAGAGYLGLPSQSATPSTPASGLMKIFADASGRLSWITSLGFKRTFISTTLTADRIYTLQNRDGVLADDTDLALKVDKTSWIDISATSTIVGFSVFTTKQIYYKKIDTNLIQVKGNLTGTSSGGLLNFTIPFTSVNSSQNLGVAGIINNGVSNANLGISTCNANSNVVNVYRDVNGTAFTTSGTKSGIFSIVIEIQP